MLGLELGEGKISVVGRRSRGPPSMDRETWIFVSLVLREMYAVRAEIVLGDMLGRDCGACKRMGNIQSCGGDMKIYRFGDQIYESCKEMSRVELIGLWINRFMGSQCCLLGTSLCVPNTS